MYTKLYRIPGCVPKFDVSFTETYTVVTTTKIDKIEIAHRIPRIAYAESD